MEFGTDEQKARFLPRIASCDDVWCQGWSEPDAGSDLAALRSRAERHGDEWVLHGQKTWCSRGAFADWMFGLFRSDPSSERHHGLTFILVPLRGLDGVTVRPIVQLNGQTGFAEVFFDGARVPVANTVAGEGDGWKVAMSTAGFERGLLLRSPARFLAVAGGLAGLWERAGRDQFEDEVVRAWIDAEAYRLYNYWTACRLAEGGTIGAEASLNKIFWSEMDLRMHETARALRGSAAEVASAWTDEYLFALAGPIYAGTNEIQRNIVAERVLGLPR
jgi:alkylation response protein AidB-like acyl-CoA dehydrogenase